MMTTSASIKTSLSRTASEVTDVCDYVECSRDSALELASQGFDMSRVTALPDMKRRGCYIRASDDALVTKITSEIETLFSAGASSFLIDSRKIWDRCDAQSDVVSFIYKLTESISASLVIDDDAFVYINIEPLSFHLAASVCNKAAESLDSYIELIPVFDMRRDMGSLSESRGEPVIKGGHDVDFVKVARDDGRSPFMPSAMSELERLEDALYNCDAFRNATLSYTESNTRSLRNQGLSRFVRWSEQFYV